MKIVDIETPDFLKDLTIDELNNLSEEIRQFLIENLAKTGGHLSSNLGAVELTIALHKVFDSPKDAIFFDVGHQCYTHKILTNRAKYFGTLRQTDGLSGFIKQSESIHDIWEAGHASTSLSGALGYAMSNKYFHRTNKVIAVIGDGSIGGGMAFEALNHIGEIGENLIIVLNDNGMSISPPVGGLAKSLSKIRYSNNYARFKTSVKRILKKVPLGDKILKKSIDFKNNFKSKIIREGKFFENLGIDYYGPIDGHNFEELIDILEFVKNDSKPVVVHVKTLKGKGYLPAMKDGCGAWHGVTPFDIETGKTFATKQVGFENWSNIIIWTIEELAVTNLDLAVITPAMENGSMLSNFKAKYPNRYFDVGIAEEHATTLAAGLALGGLHPVLAIYSTFLQRGYDQLLHDICRMKTRVVICVDRSGLVGADGDTHHGIYDVAFLKTIPNMAICMPRNSEDAQHLLNTCIKYNGPIAIRYPRGGDFYEKVIAYKEYEIGEWEVIFTSKKQVLITYGSHVDLMANYINENNLDIGLVNARFIKPFDENLLKQLLDEYEEVYVYEEVVESNNLYSDIVLFANKNGYSNKIESFCLPNKFIEHGNVNEVLANYGLDYPTVFNKIMQR